MDLVRVMAGVSCAVLGVACSASESPAPPGPAAPDASDAGEIGSPDAPLSDASAPDEGRAPDTSTPTMIMCEAGHFDVSVPRDGSCPFGDDTDRDGVPDCVDGCPYDVAKIAPGVCGCGIPDGDKDGDGIADCMDQCPDDPNNMRYGECGCAGALGLKPAGTLCTDTGCPQPGATCDKAGICGDRNSCNPCPGGHLIFTGDFGRAYWFCGSLPSVTGPTCESEDGGGGPTATRMAAQSACAAKGLTLLRPASLDENRFMTRLMTGPVWLGANDLQTAGQWYWSSATSDSDTLFWDGGPDGSREDSFFVNWAAGAPGSGRCAFMDVDGRWSDTDCNRQLAYICEYPFHL